MIQWGSSTKNGVHTVYFPLSYTTHYQGHINFYMNNLGSAQWDPGVEFVSTGNYSLGNMKIAHNSGKTNKAYWLTIGY